MNSSNYCSQISSAHHAPLHGSAVHVDYWLLIEYGRSWRAKAVNDNDLGDAVNQHIAQLTQHLADQHGKKLRTLLIKQNDAAENSPKVFIADGNATAPRMVVCELSHYDELLTLSATNVINMSLKNGTVCEQGIHLVCTNGQRDICCGQFGMPLYRQLREYCGNSVWQCTHIGGHRFAPNVLCLPSGLVYGFVSPNRAQDVIDNMNRNEITLDLLRGRSSFSPAAQAAEYFLRQALKINTNNAVMLDTENTADAQSNTIAVIFTVGGKRHCVKVGSRASEYALPASCGAVEKPVNEFVLSSIELLS